MKRNQQVDKLARMLAYMLGRQPDEFGLVPDTNGYITIKDLLKALAEEPGWRHVRMNDLREVTISGRSSQVEITGHWIRAVDRTHLFLKNIPDICPKLLYYPIRQRAYPVVLQKGIPPDPSGNLLTLTIDEAFANRLGRRIDQAPIILVVNSTKAISYGASLWRFGRRLFLLDQLPRDSFHGPPPPKPRQEPQKAESITAPATPGSYMPDLSTPPTTGSRYRKTSRPRKNEWKRERKQKNRRNVFD